MLLDVLAPLFGAILIGLGLGLGGVFPPDAVRAFSRLVFLVAMPVGVFDFMSRADPPEARFLALGLGYLGALAVAATLAIVLARRIGRLSVRDAGPPVFAVLCSNAVFLGLPVALSVPDWGRPFLMLMILEGFFVFGIVEAMLTWPEAGQGGVSLSGALRAAAARAARSPIVIATAAGTLVSVSGLAVPDVIGGPLQFVGRIAAPLGLMVLGLSLAGLMRQRAGLPVPLLLTLLPVKLLVFPVVAGLITWALGGDAQLIKVGVLFTLLPPAVSSLIIATAHSRSVAPTAALVAVGTVIGLLTLTAFLAYAIPIALRAS